MFKTILCIRLGGPNQGQLTPGKTMKPLIVIPARYQSSRFPGKPLVSIQGKPMIQWVWEVCTQVLDPDRVLVATDDERIAKVCHERKMLCEMTSPTAKTGTDRVAEVARRHPASVYINVQGDEPMILPEDITKVITAALQAPEHVYNGMCRLMSEEEYLSTSVPKILSAPNGRLLYATRAPAPGNKEATFQGGSKQVCIYSFSAASLEAFTAQQEKTPLESIEDIEILRFLELGLEVRMVQVSGSSIAVDHPEDVTRVIAAMRKREAA
jgi:3-deoxy-manno-octulosonate cytidylyltransferase (CMP-KDO synthetase)